MSIYQEVLSWSQSKPIFLRDALRRLITNTQFSTTDITELVELLKKENGIPNVTLTAVPLDATHLPANVSAGTSFPRLTGIKNPINICALYNEAQLQFPEQGLTIVYGNNGSGKSSYSRILKKLCWSRHSDITLKKNIFNRSASQQQVDIEISYNGSNTSFHWTENSPTTTLLKSINVFDVDCAEIYLNRENATEYKPVGIDLLERLIPVMNSIAQVLNSEIGQYNTQKPAIDPSLFSTPSGNWYANLEGKKSAEAEAYIQFTQGNSDRKNELSNLISTQNPQENIQNLENLKIRLRNYGQQLKVIEKLHAAEGIEEIKNLRSRFESINSAYDIATNELKDMSMISGFGTNPWRTLWEAAKSFAHASGMSDGMNFPSGESLERCVLCQQELDEQAAERMEGFSRFVLNDVSTQIHAIQVQIQQKIVSLGQIIIPTFDNIPELSQLIPDFQKKFSAFELATNAINLSMIDYLQNGGEIHTNPIIVSDQVVDLIPALDKKVNEYRALAQNRNSFIEEHNELLAKEFLFLNKANIVKYVKEYNYKKRVTSWVAHTNTASISRKIGDLMENQAVALQHRAVVDFLSFFNPVLASKVVLSKTRTSQGNTFQRMGLSGISDPIDSVLSEGEQKIVSLANFLAECTIDGRKNTMIFDDPVSSLDADYRELIATKLAQLSQDRQIVVLTHDLSFLRLLTDIHKTITNTDCHVIGIAQYNGISGISSDEIPYLVKNIQERIDSIRRILVEHDALLLTDGHGRDTKLDAARKRFRMLLERSVEEILSNKTIERFSKNIHLKKGHLTSYIVTERNDIDFLLRLFGKYSVTEHDGGTSTVPQLPSKADIEQDLREFSTWKEDFKTRLRAFAQSYN
jgi:energy-coupling factor transporter ATP-binding protein EcfA2